MRKRDRKYKVMVKVQSDKLKEEVRQLKREIQRKTRLAHWDHVNKLFVEKEGEGPSG